jgi:hypothetical protein
MISISDFDDHFGVIAQKFSCVDDASCAPALIASRVSSTFFGKARRKHAPAAIVMDRSQSCSKGIWRGPLMQKF